MKNSFHFFAKIIKKLKQGRKKYLPEKPVNIFCIFHLWYFHSIDKKHINRFNRIRCTITMQIFKYIFFYKLLHFYPHKNMLLCIIMIFLNNNNNEKKVYQ